jgi:aurora kinase
MAPTTRSASRSQALHLEDENKENKRNCRRSTKLCNKNRTWCDSNLDLLEELGGGAQSHVVKGRDKIDGSIYAIKIIDYNCNRKYADRELKIHQSLDYPGVVRLHGHYFVSDHPSNSLCLVLEYCPHTMLDVTRDKPNGRIDEAEAAIYMADITKTLVYLHEKKVMHRDIKLSNILVSTDNKAKIADFGISASIRDPHLRKTIIGTEGYMAPEIENNTAASEEGKILLSKAKEGGAGLAGLDIPVGVDLYNSQYNEKVDLWSLGATLYAMVSGNLPCEDDETEYNSDFDFSFEGSSSMNNFDLPDFLSIDVCDLILGLLEEDPNDRISLEDVQNHPWIKKHT